MVEEAKLGGIEPLDLMLQAMRKAWEAGDVPTAQAYAKDAAPYIHPRLTAAQVTGKDGGPLQTEDATKRTPSERKAEALALAAAIGAKLVWPEE